LRPEGHRVKVFDSTSDSTATQVVDLRARVQDFWDRGLLGLAVDPGFGAGRNFIGAGRNFIYVLYTHIYLDVLYTHDFNPEGSPTSWGDGCPPRQGPPPTAARSPATCPGSRSTPAPGWPPGRSSR
jgi:hypothetical protein